MNLYNDLLELYSLKTIKTVNLLGKWINLKLIKLKGKNFEKKSEMIYGENNLCRF